MSSAALLLLASAAWSQVSTAAVAASTPTAPVQASTAAVLPGYQLPASTLTPKVEYDANEVEYDRNGRTLHLRGNVRLRDPQWTVKTDQLKLNLDDRTGEAFGFVLLEQKDSAVWGDHATFDLAEHEAELSGANGGYRPWYVQASTLTLSGGVHEYRNVSFTTCNLVPEPHYYMHASVLRVKPKEYVSGRNVVVWLGSVPVFYLPYFYNSLDTERPFSTAFRFGVSARNGFEALTATLFQLGRHSYGRLYLDEYTKRGVGTGAEYNRNAADMARESLYGYHITDPGGTQRWTVLGNAFQPLGGPFSAQARLQLQSDPQFNNDYFRSNFFAVTPELRNSAAFVRQTKTDTERLSFDRLDEASGDNFTKLHQSLPRFDYNSAPLSGPWGVVQTVAGFAENDYELSDGFQHQATSATWTASKSVYFARGFSFVPRVTAGEMYINRFSTNTASGPMIETDGLFTRYGGGGDFRWAAPVGNIDLDYNFLARSRSQGLELDSLADDRGIESSHVTLSDLWRPNRLAWLRLQGGYDLRPLRAGLNGDQRYDPITGLLTLQPTKRISVSAMDVYSVAEGNESGLIQADWGQMNGDRVGIGMSNSRAQPGKTFVSQSASYGRGTWRLGGAVRYVAGGGQTFDAFEKVINLEKTFHDFYTFWQFRDRTGARDFGFKIALLFNYEKRAAGSSLENEREWYPWRERPDGR
jgi:hypothetical protein